MVTRMMSSASMRANTSRSDVPPIPIRKICRADLWAALREGYGDFIEKRGDLVVIGLVYPFFGIPAAIAVMSAQLPALFPWLAGMSLLGPLLATGYYELARRREAGLDARWRHFWDVFRGPQRDDIAAVGAMLVGIFFLWLFAAAVIYNLSFNGARHNELMPFLRDVLTTQQGLMMIILGNIVGVGFALLVLALGVVSMPMLVDRRIDAGLAIRTSIRAFRANPLVLIQWGLIVGTLLVVGMIPMFVGLAVVFPILGYASWHLYTRLVDSKALPPA